MERRKLNSLQTACILATCQINLRTQHRDDLVIEKCLTFVDEVANVFLKFLESVFAFARLVLKQFCFSYR